MLSAVQKDMYNQLNIQLNSILMSAKRYLVVLLLVPGGNLHNICKGKDGNVYQFKDEKKHYILSNMPSNLTDAIK